MFERPTEGQLYATCLVANRIRVHVEVAVHQIEERAPAYTESRSMSSVAETITRSSCKHKNDNRGEDITSQRQQD